MGRDTLWGIPLSYISLVTLAFQNAFLIIIMHYSRIMPLTDHRRYFASTAVFLNEAIKLAISAIVALREAASNTGESPYSMDVAKELFEQIFSNDGWKLAIPAALYTLQNTLQYIAVSNLDAATFQVTYQLKILTTALFSVILLKRSLSSKKWFSLLLLTMGVAIVQINTSESEGTSPTGKLSDRFARWMKQEPKEAAMNRTVGLLAVIVACITSGLAGVYFEKVLKDSNKVTVWVRNVQLSFYSLFPAFFIGVLLKDGQEIAKEGFFVGYNWAVWSSIACQAVGGLLVALVVNYADNIAKNFATSISILISFLASVWLFNFTISINFLVGMAVVLYATFLYSGPDRRPSMRAPVEPPSELSESISRRRSSERVGSEVK